MLIATITRTLGLISQDTRADPMHLSDVTGRIVAATTGAAPRYVPKLMVFPEHFAVAGFVGAIATARALQMAVQNHWPIGMDVEEMANAADAILCELDRGNKSTGFLFVLAGRSEAADSIRGFAVRGDQEGSECRRIVGHLSAPTLKSVPPGLLHTAGDLALVHDDSTPHYHALLARSLSAEQGESTPIGGDLFGVGIEHPHGIIRAAQIDVFADGRESRTYWRPQSTLRPRAA